MRTDDFPHLVSEPAADGLPDTADHDSIADDERHSAREADGRDPAALPGDRPLGLDAHGTTAAEERHPAPLDERLTWENPEVRLTDPTRQWSDEERPDTDVLDPPPQYDPHDPVSMYDRPLDDRDAPPVGRLVAPDGGSGLDREAEALAVDAGAAGGAATAEEAAMHIVPEEGR
ncbi:hypothetical protein GCM10010124_04670 [Pilimelia terevasa]|uniref:DUF5709 domain-containing protein n=1 Tax=Pilimelia terevasa TaxID=53372 RepID=A0A8J3BJA4_9ACTN|nr:DUF5709 domain-containing protein [Pilimelia terevasa]GGK15159.1 hypothetical protein GCM10010124_04670 [Pilimelia terevasa]